MRDLLGHKAMHLDRAVCCFLVAVNVGAFSTKVELRLETVIGAVNASLAAALLAASLWRPRSYAQSRLLPVVTLRLLVCALPLLTDTVGPFNKDLDQRLPSGAWLLGRTTFMVLVGISWAIGLFVSTFLLLPPAQHVAVQAAALAALLQNNRSVCQLFLQQHPSNEQVIDVVSAVLNAGVASVAPAMQQEFGALGAAVGKQASCEASAASIQVSLGLVLPTILAWQLQHGMAASIAAHARSRRDLTPRSRRAMVDRISRCQEQRVCGPVAKATQGLCTKLLLTAGSMLVTHTAALLALGR